MHMQKIDLMNNTAFNRICALAASHDTEDPLLWSGQFVATFPDDEIQQLLKIGILTIRPHGSMPTWCPGCRKHCPDKEAKIEFLPDYIQRDYVECSDGRQFEIDPNWKRTWVVSVEEFRRIFGRQRPTKETRVRTAQRIGRGRPLSKPAAKTWRIEPAPKDEAIDILAVFGGHPAMVHWNGQAYENDFMEFDGEPDRWARIVMPVRLDSLAAPSDLPADQYARESAT